MYKPMIRKIIITERDVKATYYPGRILRSGSRGREVQLTRNGLVCMVVHLPPQIDDSLRYEGKAIGYRSGSRFIKFEV